MLSVRLSAQMEKKLTALSKKTGKTKSFYVQQALAQNFQNLEHLPSPKRASLRFRPGECFSQEDVERRYGR